jgi:lipoate-protein ligase A
MPLIAVEVCWRYINSGKGDAAYNMALDEAIALSVIEGNSPPTLRIYQWNSESITIGMFQDYNDIDLEYCNAKGIPIVRRPTGGRAILHSNEITYSFAARGEGPFKGGLMGTFRLIGMAFLRAFQQLGISVEMRGRPNRGKNLIKSPLCFNSVSLGEISYNGKKLIGSAQRRWTKGFLQQGSIPLSIDYDKTAKAFKQKGEICGSFAELFKINSAITIEEVSLAIVRGFEEVFSVALKIAQPSAQEIETAQSLLEHKYLSPHWALQGRSRACKRRQTLRQSL